MTVRGSDGEKKSQGVNSVLGWLLVAAVSSGLTLWLWTGDSYAKQGMALGAAADICPPWEILA